MRVFLLVVAVVAAGCGNVKESLVERAIADLREEAGLVERTTVLDGRTVAYLERPGAEPTVVLVHGFGAQKDAWIRFAEAYPEGQRLVVPDLAGHGDSVRDPDATYDTQRLTAELSALLDVVAPDRIDVAGNSLGGAIAARLALVRPQVRRLVLLDPAGVRGPTPTPLDTLLAQGESALVPTTRAEFDRLVDLAFVSDPEIPGIARDVLT
ncbi:MAG: alpha/beta fold hydrolase, partial [Bacteroidota bacterium]